MHFLVDHKRRHFANERDPLLFIFVYCGFFSFGSSCFVLCLNFLHMNICHTLTLRPTSSQHGNHIRLSFTTIPYQEYTA